MPIVEYLLNFTPARFADLTVMAFSQPLELNFGVELEFVLAKKRDLKPDRVKIDASESNATNQWIFPGHPNRLRPRRGSGLALDVDDSRGTNGDGNDDVGLQEFNFATTQDGRDLAQYAARLSQVGCPTSSEHRSDKHAYDAWILVGDSSVDAEDDREVEKEVSARLGKPFDTIDGRYWDTVGGELVSRILPLPPNPDPGTDSSLLELSRFVAAVRDIKCPDLLTWTNASTGLHIHVSLDDGADSSSRSSSKSKAKSDDLSDDSSMSNTSDESRQPSIPRLILQHLVYLLVQFEPHITTLHPQHRHGLEHLSYNAGKTNLIGLMQDNHICPSRPRRPIQEIQNIIFAPTTTTRDLIPLMSKTTAAYREVWPNRNRFVNFVNLDAWYTPDAKNTLEFRQHTGTLDPEEVVRWVVFVTSLLRTAERLANTPPMAREAAKSAFTGPSSSSPTRGATSLKRRPRIETSKYPTACRDGYAESIEPLFELMQLPESDVAYWRARAVKFAEQAKSLPEIDWEQSCKGCKEHVKYLACSPI